MKGMKGMRGGHAQHGVSAFEREMDASMARMMQDMHGPGFVGQADIDFLAMRSDFGGVEIFDMPANNLCLVWRR